MNLRIHLTASWLDAASPCAWALLDDHGTVRESGTSNLAAMPQSDDATVIVSADRVLATTAAMVGLASLTSWNFTRKLKPA